MHFKNIATEQCVACKRNTAPMYNVAVELRNSLPEVLISKSGCYVYTRIYCDNREFCVSDSQILLTITCTDPTSSVLQDSHVPTLTRLDGDYWANQLFTLHTTTRLATDITFDFLRTPDFTRFEIIEVVIFNCPEWGMEIQNIRLLQTGFYIPSTHRLLVTP